MQDGFALQRSWSAHVVPLLSAHGLAEGTFRLFARLSRPLNPWVDWSFGFNSGESSFEQAMALFRDLDARKADAADNGFVGTGR